MAVVLDAPAKKWAALATCKDCLGPIEPGRRATKCLNCYAKKKSPRRLLNGYRISP